MDAHLAMRDGQLHQRWPHPNVEGGADGPDHRGARLDVEGAGGIMADFERCLAFHQAHLAAIAGESRLDLAITVEMEDGPVLQRDVAHLAYARFIAFHPAERAHGHDRGEDEQ